MIFQFWGSTTEEVLSSVVGDNLCPDATLIATRSITISAAPQDVFPWIRQMGFGRAGWYSYDWLDNLGRKSATRVHTERMFACASQSGRLLVEAVWGRWHPRFSRMVNTVANGAIGNIEHIETAFTFTSEMTNNYRLNPLMGGGALLDVGCYQAHAWVALTNGAKDLEINDLTRTIGPTGIDLTTDVSVRINKSITAHAVSSFALPGQQQFVVQGSQGKM